MKFLLSFFLTYFIISLPDILGFTFTVQWVAGVSNWQKAWVYLKQGLLEQTFLKLLIATVSSILFGFILKRKKDS
jgi:hypothetical protein